MAFHNILVDVTRKHVDFSTSILLLSWEYQINIFLCFPIEMYLVYFQLNIVRS
jgi:hypothetical protein